MNPGARSSLMRLKRKRKDDLTKKREIQKQTRLKYEQQNNNNNNNNNDDSNDINSSIEGNVLIENRHEVKEEIKEDVVYSKVHDNTHIDHPHSHIYHPPERQYSDEQNPIFLEKSISLGTFQGAPTVESVGDIGRRSPLIQIYIPFSKLIYNFVYSNLFSGFVTFCIILAGILVGVQTYDSMKNIYALRVIDYVILAIFGIEVIFKIIAEGIKPLNYFIGEEWKWNNFDFWIVLFGLPIWGADTSVAFLRLLRLLRIVKLFRKVQQLQIIVMGLVGGISSIGYILLLLLLVFYLYAIAGIYAFRDNDPWHFGSLPIALVTLFRSSTLEDWSDIMYINIWGCEEYPGDTYVDPSLADDEDSEYFCNNPNARQIVAPAFFITFIVISALVMLSLFVGAVTMSMASSMEELKRTKEEEDKMRRADKAAKKLLEAKKHLDSKNSENDSGFSFEGSDIQDVEEREINHSTNHNTARKDDEKIDNHIINDNNKNNDENKDENNNNNNNNKKERIELLITEVNDNKNEEKFSFRSLVGKQFTSRVSMPSMFTPKKLSTVIKIGEKKPSRKKWQEMRHIRTLLRTAWGELSIEEMLENEMNTEDDMEFDFISKKYYQLSLFVEKIVSSKYFQNFIIAIILLAGILVGIQTSKRLMKDDQIKNTVDILDKIVISIFTAEVIVKVIAEGFDPLAYWKNAWNMFDFLIVVGSYIPGTGSLLTMLRLLRLLRVLKLIKSLPQLAVIVNAMIMGMSSIGYIGVILILAFYIFAILGMLLFESNDPWHFGTLHISLLTLFRCATLEDWADVMYINMYGCRNYGYDDWEEECVNSTGQPFLAILYFVTFTVIAALVLLTLFIGVVTTSMDQAEQDQELENEIEKRLDELQEELNIKDEEIELYRKAFKVLDLDGGGTIEEEELRTGLKSVNIEPSEKDMNILVKEAGMSDDEGIDLPTFVFFMQNIKNKRAEAMKIELKRQESLERNFEEKQQKELEKKKQKELELVEKIGYFAVKSNKVVPLPSPISGDENEISTSFMLDDY